MSKHRVRSPSSTRANGSKKSGSLPTDAVEYLKAWMMSPEHIAHPYPTDIEKVKIMEETGIELKQLTNWFVNNRKRYWKPRVEGKIQEQGRQFEVVQPSKKSSLTKSRISINSDLSISSHELQNLPSRKSEVIEVVSSISTDEDISNCEISRPLAPSSASTSVSDLSNMADSNEASRAFVTCMSLVSDTESGTGMDHNVDEEYSCDPVANEQVVEYFDVHILRPQDTGMSPTFLDVSVLPRLPQSRILRTFKHQTICYSFSNAESVRNDELTAKISSARDSEIVRLKKRCLCEFLKGKELVRSSLENSSISAHNLYGDFSRKRHPEDVEGNMDISPQEKLRRVSVDGYCTHVGSDVEVLPTIEEAAQLFGFAQAVRKEFN